MKKSEMKLEMFNFPLASSLSGNAVLVVGLQVLPMSLSYDPKVDHMNINILPTRGDQPGCGGPNGNLTTDPVVERVNRRKMILNWSFVFAIAQNINVIILFRSFITIFIIVANRK